MRSIRVGEPVFPHPYEPEVTRLQWNEFNAAFIEPNANNRMLGCSLPRVGSNFVTLLMLTLLERHDVPEISKTKLTWITTSSALKELVATLDRAKEFAIAVHQHDYHSYLGTSLHVFHLGFSIYHSLMIGFVALMQISTRTEDFLVDSIVLFEELHLLNQVTTNPNILKVRFCCRCIV